MTTDDWHAPPATLALFARSPETIDDATASSIELHLLACDACRRAVAAHADRSTLAASWDGVADRIDTPRPQPVERLLRLLGVRDTYARLVGATPALALAWLGAMVAVVASVVLVADVSGSAGPFLVVAPMIPLASVAVAFAASSDPAGEASRAAPLNGVAVALRRAVAVLASSLVVLALGALALPHLAMTDAAWVLPALGLSLAALALGTRIRTEVAAGALGGGWLVLVSTAVLVDRVEVSRVALLSSTGQVAFALVGVAAVATLYLRREHIGLELS
jgi:hypothetical protein